MEKQKTIGQMTEKQLCKICNPQRLPKELRCPDCKKEVNDYETIVQDINRFITDLVAKEM